MRSAWLALNLLVSTPPLSLVVILLSLLRVETSLYESIPRFWSRWLLWAAGARVEIHGVEHIVRDRPQIIACNHTSWFDVLAIAAYMPKRNRFVAKKELARVPLWGRAWRASGHIAIDRTDTPRAVAALETAAAIVRADCSAIVIFPEGTRSATGALQPFKKGAFMLALQTGFEIVPTAVTGTHHIIPRSSWRVRSGRIILRFGPPIHTSDYDTAHRDELMRLVRSEIERLLAVPAPEN